MHSAGWKAGAKSVGFVPTMGALHEGHLSLVRQSRRENDVTVVSIFVNPLQFNNAMDLEKYPRTELDDLEKLEMEQVDCVFVPSVAEFYTIPSTMQLDFGPVAAGLEGAMRPGHFSGVGIVVARLFHLVNPTRAYFGSKDLQQVAVIKTLVRDMAFDIEVIRCQTLREPNGLAMSSRNHRLSKQGKEIASNLSKALETAIDEMATSGFSRSREMAIAWLKEQPGIEIEYLEWVNADTMALLTDEDPAPEPAICLAAWVEGVRLIDNMIVPKRNASPSSK